LVSSWKRQARRELIELRGDSCAWGYRRTYVRSAEPTALACLGLLASGDQETSAFDLETAQKGAEWLATIQMSDGSIPVSEGLSSPGWPTPYGLLLWNALSGYEVRRERASAWLVDLKGETIPRAKGSDQIVGHDSSLLGWPWVAGTHSWVEPTALSILALCREGLDGHSRVDAGIRLILDRSLQSGGWNCGNKSVFGTGLRAQPASTGLALLALAAVGGRAGCQSVPQSRGLDGGDRAAAVERAIAYLVATLADLGAPVSVGWGVLALRAHQALPAKADDWLANAHARSKGRPDAAMGQALLLLASSDQALCLLTTPCSTRT
jgi:hypothetical protein